MRLPLSNTLITIGMACCLAAGAGTAGAASGGACTAPVATPSPPLDAPKVTDFGAKADDGKDDGAAIQKALDALESGQTLVFPPGRYDVGRSLRLTVDKTTMLGAGATIHSTNADDQSFNMAADGAALHGLTFTAVTAGRKSGMRHHRVTIHRPSKSLQEKAKPVSDVLIAGIRIVPAATDDPARANAGSAAGIYVGRAQRFVISGNQIVRTLADGIHVSNGARDGVIVNNMVRETGDDMIAMVAYAKSPARAAPDQRSDLADRFDELSNSEMVRNLLVERNDLSGNYWGRGVTVAGGADITIRANDIHDMPIGAGAAILLARDQNYSTFGVDNIVVERNTVRNIQVARASYVGRNAGVVRASGHAAIEVHALLFRDELDSPVLAEGLSVRRIAIRQNTLSNLGGGGIRTGAGAPGSVASKAGGQSILRGYRSGVVRQVAVSGNRFEQLKLSALSFQATGTDQDSLSCSGNTLDGKPANAGACRGTALAVEGARVACDASGRILQ